MSGKCTWKIPKQNTRVGTVNMEIGNKDDRKKLSSSQLFRQACAQIWEKAMAPHSWKIPRMEEPGRLQSMGWLRVGHHWATSFSLFYHFNSPFSYWSKYIDNQSSLAIKHTHTHTYTHLSIIHLWNQCLLCSIDLNHRLYDKGKVLGHFHCLP